MSTRNFARKNSNSQRAYQITFYRLWILYLSQISYKITCMQFFASTQPECFNFFWPAQVDKL